MAREITIISAERIADELRKMLVHRNRAWALRQMDELGLLKQVLPEVQNGVAWRVVEALEEPVSFPLALAALLHMIGKRAAGKACRRLKLSNEETSRVEWLVDKHEYLRDAPTMRPSQLKPILVHPGIGALLALHRAIAVANGRPATHVEFCEQMLRDTPRELLDPPPLLSGDDLLALGWEQGPLFKKVLDAVREAQLDGTITTKEEAIRLAEQLKN
jgi:poly(A) polymerase